MAIAHSKPMVGHAEALAVDDVLQSGNIAQGERVADFEKRFCERFGFRHASATASGTAALHLVLLAMDIGIDDEVIIPSFVCTALVNAVRYVGAIPVLADVDPETGNIDAKDVHKRLTTKTRSVIVPHMFGQPAEIDGLLDLDIPIIEDCAQAIGAVFKGRPVGTYGSAAIYSFYATKVMTTAEGGMVAANSARICSRVRDLRSYDNKEDGALRFNYKMSDIQAAMGVVQLGRLDELIARRKAIARKYSTGFSDLKLQLPAENAGHIHYRYVIRLPERHGVNRWIEAMRAKGVCCARPVHRPLHQIRGLSGFPGAERAWKRMLSIPIYPALADGEVEHIIDALKQTAGELGCV